MTKKRYQNNIKLADKYFWDAIIDDECLETAGGDLCLIFFLAASKHDVSIKDLARYIMQESDDNNADIQENDVPLTGKPDSAENI